MGITLKLNEEGKHGSAWLVVGQLAIVQGVPIHQFFLQCLYKSLILGHSVIWDKNTH